MEAGLPGSERAASQRELDALARRVEGIDEHGTRGAGIIQTQLIGLIKDVAKLEARLEAHEQLHHREAQDRETDRKRSVRWRVTATTGAAASLATILGLLAEIAGHLHG